MRAAQAIAVLALAMSTLSAGRLWGGQAPAGTDRDRFLKAHPNASSLEWKTDAERPYLVLYAEEKGKNGWQAEGSVAVFDHAGRQLYKRRVENREDSLARRKLGPPKIVPVAGRVLGFLSYFSGVRYYTTHIVLVGFKDDRPVELELDYTCHTGYPYGYHYRTWLEDVGGDDNPEVCRFVRTRFRVLRWDTEKGGWQRLPQFTGKRIGATGAPIQWRVTTKLEEKARRIQLTLRMTSLVDRPLLLSESLQPLFGRHAQSPIKGAPSFGAVRWGRRNSKSRRTTCWQVTPADRVGEPITIAPLGTRFLSFTIAMPEGASPEGRFEFGWPCGRARWGAFEAEYGGGSYSIPLTHVAIREKAKIDRIKFYHCLLGVATQDEIDDHYRRQLTQFPGRGVYTRYLSAAMRKWLLARVPSDKCLAVCADYLRMLHLDMADETGHLALDALKKRPKVEVWHDRELLLLALRRRDPSEYKAIIQEAATARKGLEPVLISLLRCPRTWADYCYRVTYLDHQALAKALADWPDPKVAALARAVLEKALLEATKRGCAIDPGTSGPRAPPDGAANVQGARRRPERRRP